MRDLIGRVWTASVVSVIAVLSVGTVAASAAGGHGHVTTAGKVGALRIDRSTASQVRRAAGPPAARQANGSFGISGPPYSRYDAMGYGCHPSNTGSAQSMPVGGQACTTVYFINVHTKRLAAFFTSSRAYTGPGGMRPGMSAARAEHLSHTPAYTGCMTGISFGGNFSGHHTAAWLFAPVFGGHAGTHPTHGGIPYYGGTVENLMLESTRHPVGLLFC
jgi:hypothetical protein